MDTILGNMLLKAVETAGALDSKIPQWTQNKYPSNFQPCSYPTMEKWSNRVEKCSMGLFTVTPTTTSWLRWPSTCTRHTGRHHGAMWVAQFNKSHGSHWSYPIWDCWWDLWAPSTSQGKGSWRVMPGQGTRPSGDKASPICPGKFSQTCQTTSPNCVQPSLLLPRAGHACLSQTVLTGRFQASSH